MYVGLSQKNDKFLNVPKATNGVWTVLSKSFEFRGGGLLHTFLQFSRDVEYSIRESKGFTFSELKSPMLRCR